MSTKKLINKLNRHDNKRKHKKISRIGLEKLLNYRIFQKMN